MSGGKMNRAQRRAAKPKKKPEWQKLTREERVEALFRNGITAGDLKREYERGRMDGFKAAGLPILKSCYAGICVALHDQFGFGEERCFRAIKAVDEKIMWALTNQELVDEVLEKTGLQINFDEPFDRVEKT